jgi:hypothetical protein
MDSAKNVNFLGEIQEQMTKLGPFAVSHQTIPTESQALLNHHSVQEVRQTELSNQNKNPPELTLCTRVLSWCCPCYNNDSDNDSGVERIEATPHPVNYGAITTIPSDFSKKLKAVLEHQNFKQKKIIPITGLRALLKDTSIKMISESNQSIILELSRDTSVSSKDLIRLIGLIKLSGYSNPNKTEFLIQSILDQREKEVVQQLQEIPFEQLNEFIQLLDSPKTSNVDFTVMPGYSKIEDEKLYVTLARKAFSHKIEGLKLELASNKSIVVPDSMDPILFLSYLDMEIDKSEVIGKGGFGRVYKGYHKVTKESLVYKEESDPEGIIMKEFDDHPDISLSRDLIRQGDFAVAALRILPHFVKTEAFIIKKITSSSLSSQGTYLVLAENIESEINNNKNIDDITILGQIMKQAPGKDLIKILLSPEWNQLTLEERIDHFDAIVKQAFDYFSEAYQNNFVHRDIKPENIIYDITTKKLTIIDAGLGIKLDVAPNIIERFSLAFAGKNPIGFKTTSQAYSGTTGYIAPALNRGLSYGAEVDAYSFGVVFLQLIDPNFSEEIIKSTIQSNIKGPFNGEVQHVKKK